MQSQVSEIDPVTVELQVEVPWDRIQKGLEDTFTKLQRTARVKGFRPGKAPRSVLTKLFSKDVKAEVVSNVMEESVIAAVRQHELPVVSNAMIDEQPKLTDGQPLAFKVKFEVRPKVGALALDLELERPSTTVGDAEVEAEVQRLREQHAVVRPLEGARPAQAGDVLNIDYDVSIDGEAKPEMKGTDRTVTLGQGRVLPELDSGLLALSVGDEKAIEVARAADDENQELAGKKVVFAVRVKEIRERILPELDDEFAKDVGEYQDLAGLRAKLRSQLEEQAQGKSDSALREQAIEKLTEANPIPVPRSLVDQQMRAMIGEYFRILEMIGQKPDLNQAGFEDMKKRAEQKVRAALLLGELSRTASITVTAADLDARFSEIATKTGKHVAKVKADHTGEKREQLETQLLEDKLIKHLLEKATIKDAAPKAKE
jgi:trigger factor